jgi:hypothetical protein
MVLLLLMILRVLHMCLSNIKVMSNDPNRGGICMHREVEVVRDDIPYLGEKKY